MTRQDGVEHRPELHGAAAHVERADLEGHDMVVAGMAEFAELRTRFRHSVFSQNGRFQHDKVSRRGTTALLGACLQTPMICVMPGR